MTYTYNYSQNEIKLFTAFNLAHLTTHLPAVGLYRLAVEEAFLNNLKGPHVAALRRGANAMQKVNPYRMTPEFDKLVEFSTNKRHFFPTRHHNFGNIIGIFENEGETHIETNMNIGVVSLKNYEGFVPEYGKQVEAYVVDPEPGFFLREVKPENVPLNYEN